MEFPREEGEGDVREKDMSAVIKANGLARQGRTPECRTISSSTKCLIDKTMLLQPKTMDKPDKPTSHVLASALHIYSNLFY